MEPDGLPLFEERFFPSKLTRRRFVQMAVLASSSIVLPIPRIWALDEDDFCTPDAVGVDRGWQPSRSRARPLRIKAPEDGDWSRVPWPFETYSYDSPRKTWIMVHHAGIPNSDKYTDPCTACSCLGGGCSNPHEYDFCIDRAGDICVTDGTGTPRWMLDNGAHAKGCNCKAVGIMLQGCFGGCSYGNVSAPSDIQLCSLAYLSLQLGTAADLNHHRPHRRCASWNPCDDPNPTITVCCGTYLTTNSDTDKWNATGEALMYDMLRKRACLAQDCSCDCRIC